MPNIFESIKNLFRRESLSDIEKREIKKLEDFNKNFPDLANFMIVTLHMESPPYVALVIATDEKEQRLRFFDPTSLTFQPGVELKKIKGFNLIIDEKLHSLNNIPPYFMKVTFEILINIENGKINRLSFDLYGETKYASDITRNLVLKNIKALANFIGIGKSNTDKINLN